MECLSFVPVCKHALAAYIRIPNKYGKPGWRSEGSAMNYAKVVWLFHIWVLDTYQNVIDLIRVSSSNQWGVRHINPACLGAWFFAQSRGLASARQRGVVMGNLKKRGPTVVRFLKNLDLLPKGCKIWKIFKRAHPRDRIDYRLPSRPKSQPMTAELLLRVIEFADTCVFSGNAHWAALKREFTDLMLLMAAATHRPEQWFTKKLIRVGEVGRRTSLVA